MHTTCGYVTPSVQARAVAVCMGLAARVARALLRQLLLPRKAQQLCLCPPALFFRRCRRQLCRCCRFCTVASLCLSAGRHLLRRRNKPTSLKDISAAEFISAYAAHLKKGGRLNLPDWVDVVKTAPGRELVSGRADWRACARSTAQRSAAAAASRLPARQSSTPAAASPPRNPPQPPLDPDWYYVRAASLARKLYLNHGLGVGALAHWYGKTTAKRNMPQKHHTASRKVIRHILAQLEELGIVEKIDKAGGRGLTAEGRKDLDTISSTAEIEL